MTDSLDLAAMADRSSTVPHDPPAMRALYRVRQFTRGLTARVTEQERTQAVAVLPERARALFLRLPVDAQRHSLNVLQTLDEHGYDHPDLRAAALLHDVGKLAAEDAGVRIGLWLRGPLVVLDAVAGEQAARLAAGDPARGWRYALYVHREHAAIGARWAADAGCSALTCWLIAHHQDGVASGADRVQEADGDQRDMLLAALYWADNRN